MKEKEKARRSRIEGLFLWELKYREGLTLFALNKLDAAIKSQKSAILHITSAFLDNDGSHPHIALSQAALGDIFSNLADDDAAKRNICESIKMMKIYFPKDHILNLKLALKQFFDNINVIERDGIKISDENFESSQFILINIVKGCTRYYESFCESMKFNILLGEISSNLNVAMHPMIADVLFVIGEYYFKAGQDNTALYIHNVCLQIRQRTLMKKSVALLLSQTRCIQHRWGMTFISETIQRASQLNEILTKYLRYTEKLKNNQSNIF